MFDFNHLFYVAMFVMLAPTFLALAHIPNASYETEALEAGDEFGKVCPRTVPKNKGEVPLRLVCRAVTIISPYPPSPTKD